MSAMAFVGASLLAKNDDAVYLPNRGVCFASRLAPTWLSAQVRNHG
ncbi:hypothetical protein SAMN04490206_5679 [Pseudomonas umsongensis]|nr:hypothetical protein SAMN04490206_5679 [Pseudomonas umsongensis]